MSPPRQPQMLTYGLTGGIGSGKSTVGRIFAEFGVPVFDADQIGRELLAEGSALTRQVLERFPECHQGEGVDRRALAARVFGNEPARRELEGLLHPAILQEFLRRQQALPSPRPPCCLIEAALFAETRSQFPLVGMVVVTAPTQVRMERVARRDGLSQEEIRGRLQAQLPQSGKMLFATHWIENGGSLADTRRQVQAVQCQLVQETGGKA